MILIITNEQDLTSDYIVLELRRRGLPFFRLNTERIVDCVIEFTPEVSWSGWQIQANGRLIKLDNVRSGYFRRPGVPFVSGDVVCDAERAYCVGEWGAVLAAIYYELEGRWLNSPTSIQAAENKPRQLNLAYKLGLSIPSTLITNDFARAACFVSAGSTVGKPLRNALLEGEEERVIFTSRISSILPEDEKSVSLSPLILQQEIEKDKDIRVTVVGNQVFPVEIHSQLYGETQVDWRRGSRPDLPHEPHALPTEIAAACIQLTQALGLRFGAVDLVLDRYGKHWFLEINPNGQWAWIESRTGLPISQAIVDELERIGGL